MLEDTEAALRKSMARLRSSGQEDGARQVERFAEWARFDLEEPLAAQQLHLAVARLRKIRPPELLGGQVLEKVLSLARADRGNLQLADSQTGALRIVAQVEDVFVPQRLGPQVKEPHIKPAGQHAWQHSANSLSEPVLQVCRSGQ